MQARTSACFAKIHIYSIQTPLWYRCKSRSNTEWSGEECCKLLSSRYFSTLREGEREWEREREKEKRKWGSLGEIRTKRSQPFFMGTRLQGLSVVVLEHHCSLQIISQGTVLLVSKQCLQQWEYSLCWGERRLNKQYLSDDKGPAEDWWWFSRASRSVSAKIADAVCCDIDHASYSKVLSSMENAQIMLEIAAKR